jgi:hypothetical protein
VFKMVVSSCSNKNATATSHGSNFLLVADGERELDIGAAASTGFVGPMKLLLFCHARRQFWDRIQTRCG